MSSRSLEPYDGPTLTRFLTDEHGAVFDRQTGSHVHLKLPSGARVGSLSQGTVPCSLGREIARTLGMSFPEYREAIGYPVQKAGRRKKGLGAALAGSDSVTASKKQVLTLAREVGDLARQMESSLRNGRRDQSVYDSAHHALTEARALLGEVRL